MVITSLNSLYCSLQNISLLKLNNLRFIAFIIHHQGAWRSTFSGTALLSSGGGQRLNDGDIRHEIVRQPVPLFQILRAVVRDPHLALRIFRNQNFQRQVDGGARRRQHQRRAALRIAEDQELGGRHFQAHLFSFAAVIDQREQRHAFGFENGLELVDRLVHGVMARNFDDPFFFLHGPSLRRVARQQSSLVGRECGGQAARDRQ